MPVLPPSALQGADADAAEVANVIDPAALGAEQALPPLPVEPATLTPEQLMAVATATPPPALPAASPVDQAIAPLLPPQGGPALSLVPPPPPEALGAPKTPGEAAQQNLQQARAIGEEQVANATEKAGLDQKAADENAVLAQEKAKQLETLLQRQELHRQAAEARTADARAKAESEPYHTYWENRSIGQNIATGIGLILGGVSWNANHVNRGVQILENAIANDLALQKEKHADLWRAVESAEKGETTLDTSQLREVAKFNAIQGAKHDAVASRLMAAVAMNKGKGDITQAKKTALDEAEKANQFWSNAAHAESVAAHQAEVDKEAARHHAEQEKTAALRAAKYKTRGGAGGGGGGARESASIELKDKISELQASGLKGLDLDKAIDREAVRLKIPLTGKPNTLNARQIKADLAKETAAEKKDLTLSDKAENTVIRDPQTREPIGRAQSAKGAAAFATRDVQLGDAAHRMKELEEDIRQHGRKVTSIEDVQRRITKYANAIIAVGIVSPLGKTNESLHLEGQSIGLPGTFDPAHMMDSLKTLVATGGANLDAVARKVTEMKHNRESYRNTLIPLTDDEKKKFHGGGEASSEHPAKVLDGVRYTFDTSKGKYVKDVLKL